MSERGRMLIGVVTTAVFVGVGITFLTEGSTMLGVGLLALGVLRGGLVVVQWQGRRSA